MADSSKADGAEAVDEFVERMGLLAQGDGLPRIAGRIMGYMIVHGGPVSFADLADRLRVSRGSVSTNTRLLESLGFLERTGRAGQRQDYFRLADAPYRRMLEGVVERMARGQAAVETARRALPQDWSGAHERLAELGTFYARAGENMRGLLDALRQDGPAQTRDRR